jgi:hypothetical protein
MIEIKSGPAPERFIRRRAHNTGTYAHVHEAIARLRPGEYFEWTDPRPGSPKRFSSIRSKLSRHYPHVEIYYTGETGGPIIVRHRQDAAGKGSIGLKPASSKESGPTSAAAAPTRPPASQEPEIHAPAPGRAQRIPPSSPSSRWASPRTSGSTANAAMLASNIREPLPGVAPRRTP